MYSSLQTAGASAEISCILCSVNNIQNTLFLFIFVFLNEIKDRLCGLVVRVPGYRSRGPGSDSGSARFSE
jgi:hypothetical protein